MRSSPELDQAANPPGDAQESLKHLTNPVVLAVLTDRSNELKGRAKYVYTHFNQETLSIVLRAAEMRDIVPEWATVCLLGHQAGMFASAVVASKWTAVSFERRTIKYIEKWVGQLIPYEVPLPPECMDHLKKLRAQMPNEEYLCPVLRTRSHLCDRWAAVVTKLELPRISLTSMCSQYRREHKRRNDLVANIRGAIRLTRRWLDDVWVTVFLQRYAKPLLEKEGLDVKNFGLFPLEDTAESGEVPQISECRPETSESKVE